MMRLSSQNLSTLLMSAKTKVSHLSYQVQCGGLLCISWGALPNQPESLKTGTNGTEISREHFQKMRKLLIIGKANHYFQPKIPQILGGKSNGTVTPVEKFPKLSVYLQGCSLSGIFLKMLFHLPHEISGLFH